MKNCRMDSVLHILHKLCYNMCLVMTVVSGGSVLCIVNRGTVTKGGSYRGGVLNSLTGWMDNLTVLSDHCVETVVRIGSVLYFANTAVRFHQGVLAFDSITVTDFSLRLLISSMRIFYTILEFILSWCLKHIVYTSKQISTQKR